MKGNHPRLKGGRVQLRVKDHLRLQWVKILNYHTYDERWLEFDAFMEDLAWKPAKGKWITRPAPAEPWSKSNFRYATEPDLSLGHPGESYLECGKEVLTLQQAGNILCTKPDLLMLWKLEKVWDSEVIKTALGRMLRPFPDWSAFSTPTEAERP